MKGSKMFFKKRRVAKEKARNEARIRFETQLEASLAGTDEIQNPAERLLKLEEIRQSANNQLNRENVSVSNKSDAIGIPVVFGGFLGGGAVGFGAVALLALAIAPVSGPLLAVAVTGSLLLLAGGIVGGLVLSSKSAKSIENKLYAKVSGHLQKIKRLSTHTSETMDTVLKENIKEISVSPLSEKVRAIPGIADKFTAAAANQFVADKAAAEAAKKAEAKDAPQISAGKTGAVLHP